MIEVRARIEHHGYVVFKREEEYRSLESAAFQTNDE